MSTDPNDAGHRQRRRPATAPKRQGRGTEQRDAVLEALAEDRFCSAGQIHAALRRSSIGIGLSTVYRVLRRLTADQLLETQRSEAGELLYRIRRTDGHHHYLLCRRCGRAERFTVIEIEDYLDGLADEFDFTDITHRIDLYGLCPNCCSGE